MNPAKWKNSSPEFNTYIYHLQDATYFFLNVAPQFQSFNGGGGNWVKLENAVRELGTK